jgi:drug/metabolite transporter (DMT)-like permease
MTHTRHIRQFSLVPLLLLRVTVCESARKLMMRWCARVVLSLCVPGLTSSLTGNLTITLRKFMSLFISVVYFKNTFTPVHWLGAGLVLLGTVLYTSASQQAARDTATTSKTKKE